MQTTRILWCAMLVTVGALDGILVYLHKTDQLEAHAPNPMLPIMLGAMSVPIALMSVVMPAKMFEKALANEKLEVVQEGRRVVAHPNAAIDRAFVLFQSPFIIGMALAESVALMGFVAGFMGASVALSSIFCVAALALMLTKYPRMSTLAAAIERATKASIG